MKQRTVGGRGGGSERLRGDFRRRVGFSLSSCPGRHVWSFPRCLLILICLCICIFSFISISLSLLCFRISSLKMFVYISCSSYDVLSLFPSTTTSSLLFPLSVLPLRKAGIIFGRTIGRKKESEGQSRLTLQRSPESSWSGRLLPRSTVSHSRQVMSSRDRWISTSLTARYCNTFFSILYGATLVSGRSLTESNHKYFH